MKKSDLSFRERLYRFLFKQLHKNKVCIIQFDTNKLKYNRIVFFLNYPKSIHFGDTLWFEPIIRSFVKNYNNVFVYSSQHMQFYFKQLGYSVIENESEISQNDILVTRIDLSYYLRGKHTIFLDFSYEHIGVKLIDYILNKLETCLKIKIDDAKPLGISYSVTVLAKLFSKFNLNTNPKYIIFNNYMDSFDLQLNPEGFIQSREELNDFARQFKTKNPQYTFIYTGSQKDSESLPTLPDFIDVDLRGKTTIEELVMLVASDQIICYIGYDTFLLHAFNLYNKDSYIKLKPGYDANYNKQVKKFVAIPFSGANNITTFIDY